MARSKEWQKIVDKRTPHEERLCREIERLRAALTEIIEAAAKGSWVAKRARAALSDSGQSDGGSKT